MSFRLRINLLYRDGTKHELNLAIPPDVAKEIQNKGLLATQVYVDEFLQFQVPDNAILSKFKGGREV